MSQTIIDQNGNHPKITDPQLDILVYNVTNSLRAFGIELDTDKLTELNDTLACFLTEKCNIHIADSDSVLLPIVRLEFDILTGTVSQEVQILDPDYNEDRILQDLQSGNLVTTIGQEQGVCQFLETNELNGKPVACINTIVVDADYDMYR